MNADDPDGTWKSYKIKILDSKIYVNFKLAWHKQVEIELSSTENEQEAPMKKKIRICFYLLSTIVSYYFYQWVPGGWGMMGLLSSPLEFKYNLKVGKLMQIIKLREHKVEHIYWLDNNINTDQSLSETLLNIQKELVANNFMLNRLLSKVEVLESNFKLNNGFFSTTNQYIDSNFLSLFPMKTKEEFLSIENKIFYKKIFVDEFAVIATLTGRGKNVSVALGNSKIIKLVKRIIKANSNNVLTDSEYETVVANWLRHGNTRLGGSNNK
ncbi:hypothetical protein QTP88_015336 [Uroleucon formosanum]